MPFADVIAVIARYAFVTSPYPLILSLEVHNEIEQQDVMATILKDTLGDMLLSEKLGERILLDALPSPEDLRGKVLVKVSSDAQVES